MIYMYFFLCSLGEKKSVPGSQSRPEVQCCRPERLTGTARRAEERNGDLKKLTKTFVKTQAGRGGTGFSLSTGEAETWSTDCSSQEKPRGAEGHHEHQPGHCYLVTPHVPRVDQCSISQLKWLLYNMTSEKK